MKRLFTAIPVILFLGWISPVWGQGIINLNNRGLASVNDASGKPLTGTSFVAQVWYGPSANSLTKSFAPSPFRASTTTYPGTWNPAAAGGPGAIGTLTGFPPGSTITMRVAVWDSAIAGVGAAEAFNLAPGTGLSEPFTYAITPDPQAIPGGMENMRSFSLKSPIPTVVTLPKDTSVVAGQTLTLTAGIAGANLVYRWQKDGVDLQASTRVAGVTSQTLTIQGAVASDAGSYRLTATNLTGSVTTPAAMVTVLVPVSLTQQPQSVVGIEGETVQLSVTATGSPSPTYQWLKNGKAVAGANQSTLSLANFAEADAGVYSVVVSNAVNAVTSTQAVVTYQATIKILANGNPVTGTVRTLVPLSIELSFAKSDWLMFYTLDGSQPTFISTLYQEPFIIAEPALLRVVAYDGLYQSSYLSNPLSIRFLKPQTIDWGNPGTVRFGDTVTLKVASSSGLPVSVSVVSGPATLTGTALKATGTGEVVLKAVQSGTDDFAPVNAQRTITV